MKNSNYIKAAKLALDKINESSNTTVPFKTNKVGPKGLYVNENNIVTFLPEEGTWCRCVMCGEWKKDQEFFGDNKKISRHNCFSCYTDSPEKNDEFIERTKENYTTSNVLYNSTNRKVDIHNELNQGKSYD